MTSFGERERKFSSKMQAVLCRAAIVREAADLDSRAVAELQAGTAVRALRTAAAASGVPRVRPASRERGAKFLP